MALAIGGIEFVGHKAHVPSDTCGTYQVPRRAEDVRHAERGADDRRRATRWMQNKSFETTKLYIGMVATVEGTAEKLRVPLVKAAEQTDGG